MFDLPGHNRTRHAFALEELDQLAQMADADPFNRARKLRDARFIFFLDRGDGHLNAFSARAFEHQEWKPSVTCYQTVLHFHLNVYPPLISKRIIGLVSERLSTSLNPALTKA